MRGKKGLSQVVSTVILIFLTVTLIAGVWTIVNGYVGSSLNKAGACNDILGKVSLNPEYTCYDSSSNSLLISISRNEFAMDSLLVAVSEEDSSRNFYLENNQKTIENLFNYKTLTPEVSLPGNESGKTYCFTGFSEKPLSVEISPRRLKSQCQVIDSIEEISFCPAAINCAGVSGETN